MRAVPFIRPPTCDSCAIHFGVRDIDSVQVRAFDRNMTIVVGLFAVLFLALMNAVSQLGGT